jgi:hypothetical protein
LRAFVTYFATYYVMQAKEKFGMTDEEDER